MTHGNTVIHRDGVELFSHTTCRFDLLSDEFTQVAEVNVARDKLGE